MSFCTQPSSLSMATNCCVVVTFLDGSYFKPLNSNDILGRVIAVDLFKSGDCSILQEIFELVHRQEELL